MTEEDIHKFKDLMELMRPMDPYGQVNGSKNHQFQLGEPYSESEIAEFEKTLQIILPEDYRFFLRHAGKLADTSGKLVNFAGPCALDPLNEIARCALESDLEKPFPFTESVEFESVPECEEWGMDEPYPGVLDIGYYGGPFLMLLVVNGPAYGTIWKHDVEFGFYTTNLSFAAWYQEWIDFLQTTALPQLRLDRVTDQIEIGMTKPDVFRVCRPIGGVWEEVPVSWDKTSYDLVFALLRITFRLSQEGKVTLKIPLDLSKPSLSDTTSFL